MTEFSTRRVLVTGAAGGVGRVTAQAFVDGGADVVGVDISEQADAPWETLTADLGDSAAVLQVAETAGDIDILVNVHGLLEAREIEDTSVEDFDRAIAVNLRSVFFLSQQLVPAMADRGWGRVINFSSVVARTGGITSTAYAAAKAGVLAVTKSMARKYAAEGVTVNAIAPAAIDTALNAFLTDDQREAFTAGIPIGRFSEPEEFSSAVLFLAGEHASFITGATLDVNGGWVMM